MLHNGTTSDLLPLPRQGQEEPPFKNSQYCRSGSICNELDPESILGDRDRRSYHVEQSHHRPVSVKRAGCLHLGRAT